MSPSRQTRVTELYSVNPFESAMVPGHWYRGNVGAGTTGIHGEGVMEASPLLIGRDCKLDRIGCEVTTGGTAGAVIRLGLYNDDRGKPGSLLLDAGTVDGTVIQFVAATITQTLKRGLIWMAFAVQGAAGTRPTTRNNNVSSPFSVGDPATSPTLTANWPGYRQTATVSGALPSSFTVNAITGSTLMICLRAV